MRSFICALGALSAFGVLGVSAQDMPADLACVDQCNNSNRDQFSTLGCTSAEDRECLCGADNFQYSVRDCAVATCPGTTEDQVQNWLGANFCAGFVDEEPEESAATTTAQPAETTTAAAEETTAPAETTEAAVTTEEPATTTQAPAEETTSPAEESVVSTPEPTPASTAAETSETSEVSETESAAATSTADENEEDEEAAAAAGGGLSQGAAVGIGVGVAVVVVAIAVVAIVLLLRKRKGNKQQQPHHGGGPRHDNISRPIQDPHAGIGRAYGGSDDFGEKRGESIEMTMTGHRYEDMIPRQTPRTMV